MKIIITGGLGFIFSHVTEYLLEKGYMVYVIDNLSAGSHPELITELNLKYPDHFIFNNRDVSQELVCEYIYSFDPDYIIHAAAISDVDYSIKNPREVIDKNCKATLNVFNAARSCKYLKKLLYVSTDEVYGECDHPKDETEMIFPKNPYAVSKAFGSMLRLAYDNTYPELKDKTCETRFCNVFGPRQDTRKIIPAIREAIRDGKTLTLHNGGEGYRQYIHVNEIPPLIETLLLHGTRTYNISSGEGYKVHELCTLANSITGHDFDSVESGIRSGMDMRYEMSSERITQEFGWIPKRTFIDSFKDYLLN